jgi:cytochrome c-type biogenesis protein CcmH/NrfG
MKKEIVLLMVVTLVVGALIGMFLSNTNKNSATATATVNQSPASAPAVNYQQKIKVLQDIVSSDANNREAWVQLGHNYFDSNQPLEAIEAYDKALQLDGNDPNVLTDQGVMYRRISWFDKAIANFIKANELNPSHLQSLYNLGIVYRDDLQDIENAKKAWNQYLQISPTGQGADNVRTMLDHLENGHGSQ